MVLTATQSQSYSENMATRKQVATQRTRNQLGKFIHFSQDTQGEELVDIKVHNPLKRLYAFLDYLKTHGELKIAFRFTVPLIAIITLAIAAISLTGFSTLNRLASVCPTQSVTHIGRLYQLTVEEPASKPLSVFGLSLTPINPSKFTTRTILQETNQTLTLALPKNLDITTFHEQYVAVTGELNLCDTTLTVASSRNLTPVSP